MNRFTIAYREDKKQISLPVERGMVAGAKACVIVQSGAFAHWDGGEPILPDQQERIRTNFVAAMKFQNVEVDVY